MYADIEQTTNDWFSAFTTDGYLTMNRCDFPAVAVHVNSGRMSHIDPACAMNRSSYLSPATSTMKPVTCSMCLTSLKKEPKTHLFWASQILSNLIGERGFAAKPDDSDIVTRYAAFITRREMSRVRKVAKKSPKRDQLEQLADLVLSQLPTVTSDEVATWRERVTISSTFFCVRDSIAKSGDSDFKPMITPHETYIPPLLQLARADRVSESRKVSSGDSDIDIFPNWFKIYEYITGKVENGSSFADVVCGLSPDQFVDNNGHIAPYTSLDSLPEKFQFNRDNFPSTFEWAKAEIAAARKLDTEVQIGELKQRMLAFAPGSEKLWVTVKPPKMHRVTARRVLGPMLWFPHVDKYASVVIQVPLSVLLMAVRCSYTEMSAWSPTCADPSGQAALEALSTLMALEETAKPSIVNAFDKAAVVAGLDPDTTYGVPNLTQAV